MKKLVSNYLSRHKNNINRLLHIIGVPLVICGIFVLLGRVPLAGALMILVGYLCQWLGHRYFERNLMGEYIILQKILRKIRGI